MCHSVKDESFLLLRWNVMFFLQLTCVLFAWGAPSEWKGGRSPKVERERETGRANGSGAQI